MSSTTTVPKDTRTWPDASKLAELSRRFPAAAISKNPKGFHYVSIDATINRFNQVLGNEWSLLAGITDISLLPTAEVTYGRGEKPGYLGYVTVSIEALGSVRCGVGSDYADDPDKVLKTAQAEAFKKAGHQFGVGLYLWNELERNLVDFVNNGDLKMAVQVLAQIEGANLTASGIAKHFGITEKQLQDPQAWDLILRNGGLI